MLPSGRLLTPLLLLGGKGQRRTAVVAADFESGLQAIDFRRAEQRRGRPFQPKLLQGSTQLGTNGSHRDSGRKTAGYNIMSAEIQGGEAQLPLGVHHA